MNNAGWAALVISGVMLIALYLFGPSQSNNIFIRRSDDRMRIGFMIINALIIIVIATSPWWQQ